MRSSVSYALQDDGFYRYSSRLGPRQRFMTVALDSELYAVDASRQDRRLKAWKLLHRSCSTASRRSPPPTTGGGYLRGTTGTFQLSNKQMRTRVTVRDISTPDRAAFQIKVSSEVASASAARHGEFGNVDPSSRNSNRCCGLQTRLGKAHNL